MYICHDVLDDFSTGWFVCGKIFLILKRNIGDQSFPSGDQKVWFVFRCEGKILLALFGDHIFPCGDWRKKLISDPVNYEVYESKEQK